MITLRQAVRATPPGFELSSSGQRLSVLSFEGHEPALDDDGALLVAVWAGSALSRVALWRVPLDLLPELARLDALFPLRDHDITASTGGLTPCRVHLATAARRSATDSGLAARRALEVGVAALGRTLP